MKDCYLYLITREDSKQYVGISFDPIKRFKRHISNRGTNPFLRNSKSSLAVLNKGTRPQMIELEKELIKTGKFELNTSSGNGGNYLGEKHPSSKLSETEVTEIVNLYNQGFLSQVEIANKFEIDKGVITQIIKGRTWSHLNLTIGRPDINCYKAAVSRDFLNRLSIDKILEKYDEITPTIIYKIIKDIDRPKLRKSRQKVTEEEHKKIKLLLSKGFNNSCIAKDMELGISTVCKWGNAQ